MLIKYMFVWLMRSYIYLWLKEIYADQKKKNPKQSLQFSADLFIIHLQTTLKETKRIRREDWQKLWSASAYQSWSRNVSRLSPFLAEWLSFSREGDEFVYSIILKAQREYAGIHVK